MATPIKIHVIETKKVFTDLTVVKLDELDLIIENVNVNNNFGKLNGFIRIAKYYQSNLSPFIHFVKQTLEKNPVAILVRNILNIHSIQPLFLERGNNASSEYKVKLNDCVYTRPSGIINGFDKKYGKFIIASEEPILINGFITSIKNDNIYEYSNKYVEKIEGVKKIMRFKNQEQILSLLISLFIQINFSISYYQSNTYLELIDNSVNQYYTNKSNILNLITEKEYITWRDEDTNNKLKYLIERLINIGLPINITKWKFSLVPLYELIRLDSMQAYLYMILYGRDSSNLSEFITNKLTHYKRQDVLNLIDKKINIKKNISKIFLEIIKQKLGIEKLNEVYNLAKKQSMKNKSLYSNIKTNSFSNSDIEINDSEFILSILSDKEKKIVINEYDNFQSIIKSQMENKCNHLIVLKKLNLSNKLETTKKLLEELKQFFSEDVKTDEFIKCNNCNYNLICPHLYDKFNMEVLNLSLEKQLDKLSTYILKIQNNTNSYFCKICSGLIVENYENEKDVEIRNKYGNFNIELRTTIWSISIKILKNFKFSSLINEKQFASSIVDFIYPLIVDVEQTINSNRKRKKSVALYESDNIDSRLYIYIVIYLYSYMIKLIQSSQNNKSLSINLGDIKPNSKLIVYVERILKQIIIDYAIILSKIEDINLEFLKELIIDAYNILNKGYVTEVTNSKPEEELIIQINLDPTLNYSTIIAKIVGDLKNNIHLSSETALYEFQYIIGFTIDDFIKNNQENIKNPEILKILMSKGDIYSHKNPLINIYKFLYEPSDKKIGKDILNIMNDLNSHLDSDLLSYAMLFTSYRLFAKNIKSVNNNAKLEEHLNEVKKFKELENILLKRDELILERVHFMTETSQFKNVETKITEVFDENGIKHIWNKKSTFYYQIEDKVIEIKGEQLTEYKLKNKHKMILLDVSCINCKKKKSELYKLSLEKTKNSIDLKYKLNSLFIFFEIRCPLNDLHEWDNKICKKCKLKFELITDVNKITNKEAIDYYETYINVFDKEKKEIVYYNFDKYKKQELQKFVFQTNYSNIVDAAELVSVPIKLIESIGNMEGREYDDVISGKDSYQLPILNSDNRIFILDSKIRSLLSKYNTLKNVNKLIIIPLFIAEYLSDINKTEYNKIFKLLPVIESDYLSSFSYFLEKLDPSDLFLFLQQKLCEIILTIYRLEDNSVSWFNNLVKNFAKKELLNIIENQKLTLKPGIFNWAIFEEGENNYEDDYEEAPETVETEELEFNPFVSDMDYKMPKD